MKLVKSEKSEKITKNTDFRQNCKMDENTNSKIFHEFDCIDKIDKIDVRDKVDKYRQKIDKIDKNRRNRRNGRK